MDEITQNITPRKRESDSMEFRLGTIEKHNQIRRISSLDGLTYFDTETGEIVMKDGSIDAGTITGADINGGTIDGTTITGGTIQTAASGTRVKLNSDGNLLFYVDNVLRMLLGTSSITFYDSTGARVGHLVGDNVSYYSPTIAFDTDIWMGNNILIFDDGAGDWSLVYGDPSSGGLRVEAIDFYCDGDISCGGTKYFNIPHPTKKNMRLKYSCPESPENLIICRGKKGETPPQHFLDISEKDTLDYVTGVEGNWIATAIRKGFKDYNPEVVDSGVNKKTSMKETARELFNLKNKKKVE